MAAVLVNGDPVLVGDVVLSIEGERLTDDYAGKVYKVGKNVVIGWAGAASVAADAVGRLRAQFRGCQISCDDLERALDGFSDLRGKRHLELTGWIVVGGTPKVIRWANYYDPVRFSDLESVIGDGGYELRKLLAPPRVRGGNSKGYDTSPLQAAGGFIDARFEEMLRPDTWSRTWGAAYDLLVLQEDVFRWLPALTYVIWDVTLDGDDQIRAVVQAPLVFKQERIHDCTVLQFKRLGNAEHEARVSRPIDHEVDPGQYLRRPFCARSPYYANCFLLHRGERPVPVLSLQLTIQGATRAGFMFHDSEDDSEPKFNVNQPVLQQEVSRMLRALRAATPSGASEGGADA